MKELLHILQQVPQFPALVQALETGQSPAAVSGLSRIHRAHFAAALGEMESAIRWQRTPVLPLLEVLQTREHCGVWFCQIRDKVQSDMTLQLAWENTFHQLSDAELRDLLCRISWSGDAQRLESTIARARAEAEQLYEKRREADRHSRSVTTTATLCGAGLMIILLL